MRKMQVSILKDSKCIVLNTCANAFECQYMFASDDQVIFRLSALYLQVYWLPAPVQQ